VQLPGTGMEALEALALTRGQLGQAPASRCSRRG
jgi:hypothetical protein